MAAPSPLDAFDRRTAADVAGGSLTCLGDDGDGLTRHVHVGLARDAVSNPAQLCRSCYWELPPISIVSSLFYFPKSRVLRHLDTLGASLSVKSHSPAARLDSTEISADRGWNFAKPTLFGGLYMENSVVIIEATTPVTWGRSSTTTRVMRIFVRSVAHDAGVTPLQ
jgi:hypothetical protein